mmetsp:Transcript_21145/g.38545  ORF Transcript_21145/g.38545 Transcript_21145/m.38545 type:complete len:252 (-) Transcript_21145:877-1632(-)
MCHLLSTARPGREWRGASSQQLRNNKAALVASLTSLAARTQQQRLAESAQPHHATRAQSAHSTAEPAQHSSLAVRVCNALPSHTTCAGHVASTCRRWPCLRQRPETGGSAGCLPPAAAACVEAALDLMADSRVAHCGEDRNMGQRPGGGLTRGQALKIYWVCQLGCRHHQLRGPNGPESLPGPAKAPLVMAHGCPGHLAASLGKNHAHGSDSSAWKDQRVRTAMENTRGHAQVVVLVCCRARSSPKISRHP